MELETTHTIDDEWESFMTNDTYELPNVKPMPNYKSNEIVSANISIDTDVDIPVPGEIYISTKSKISYLNQEITFSFVFLAEYSNLHCLWFYLQELNFCCDLSILQLFVFVTTFED